MLIDHEAVVLESMGLRRAPGWEAYAAAFLLAHPHCLVCGRSDVPRNVHHEFPVSYVVPLGRGDLELDERNAAFTLCVEHGEEHHCLVGHLGLYASYNPALRRWLGLTRGRTTAQIRAMAAFQRAVSRRPRPMAQLGAEEQQRLRARLDRRLPRRAA